MAVAHHLIIQYILQIINIWRERLRERIILFYLDWCGSNVTRQKLIVTGCFPDLNLIDCQFLKDRIKITSLGLYNPLKWTELLMLLHSNSRKTWPAWHDWRTTHSETLERSGDGGGGGVTEGSSERQIDEKPQSKRQESKRGRERRGCVWRG